MHGPIDDPCRPWNEAMLLHLLANKIRVRVEPGRDRLDMKKVVHLEMLMPDYSSGGSRWTPISTAALED